MQTGEVMYMYSTTTITITSYSADHSIGAEIEWGHGHCHCQSPTKCLGPGLILNQFRRSTVGGPIMTTTAGALRRPVRARAEYMLIHHQYRALSYLARLGSYLIG